MLDLIYTMNNEAVINQTVQHPQGNYTMAISSKSQPATNTNSVVNTLLNTGVVYSFE